MKIGKDFCVYLWQSGYENNPNTDVIGGERTVLIDPGHSAHIEKRFAQMEEDGISPEGVDLVILTHSHPDHSEGLEALFHKPVKIAMNREERDFLNDVGKRLFEMMGMDPPKYRVDLFLKEGELRVGKNVFQIHPTPGHSPGSITIHWPERKALFTGDLLFYRGIGRTDFLGGDFGSLVESIDRMSRLDAEVLLPGHGEVVVGKEKVLENFEFVRQQFFSI